MKTFGTKINIVNLIKIENVMSTAELKLDIINTITNLKEPYIIEEIKRLLDFELDDNRYKVTENQRKRLSEAKSDKIISESEANTEIEKWLNEK
jgi:hypothetical protein